MTRQAAISSPAALASRRVMPASGSRRGGAVLIVVMSLMASLAFLGFFFYEWTELEDATTVSVAQAAESIEIDPKPILDLGLEQVIVGTRDGYEDSVLSTNKQSILATIIGRLDGRLRPLDGVHPHAGAGIAIVPRYTGPDGANPATDPVRPLGILDGAVADPSNVSVGSATNGQRRKFNGYPDLVQFLVRGADQRPRLAESFANNGDFSLLGPETGTTAYPFGVMEISDDGTADAWGLNFSRVARYSTDPLDDAFSSGVLPDYDPAAGYTYPDINSLFLAVDTYVEPFGGVDPTPTGTGETVAEGNVAWFDNHRYRVIIPSFFRPQYFPSRRDSNGWDNDGAETIETNRAEGQDVGPAGFDSLYTDGATDGTNELYGGAVSLNGGELLGDTHEQVLSPHAQHLNTDGSRRFLVVGTGQDTNLTINSVTADHAAVDDDGDNSEDPVRTGDTTRAIGPFPFRTDINGDGIANTMGVFSGLLWAREGAELYELPTDADGDGIRDAILMDLDHPIIDLPDGRQVVPLYSFKIVSLDGRINLNAHGNADGLVLEQLKQSRADDFGQDVTAAELDVIYTNAGNVLSRQNALVDQLFGTQLGLLGSISRSEFGVTPFEINPTWALDTVSAEVGLDPNYDLVSGSAGGLEEYDLTRYSFGRQYWKSIGFVPGQPSLAGNYTAPSDFEDANNDTSDDGSFRLAMANLELANLMLGRVAADGQVRVPGRYGEADLEEAGTQIGGSARNNQVAKLGPASHGRADAADTITGHTPGPGYSHQSLRTTPATADVYDPNIGNTAEVLGSYSVASDDDRDGSLLIDDVRRREAGMAYQSPFLGGLAIPAEQHPFPGRPTFEPFRTNSPDGTAAFANRGLELDLVTGINIALNDPDKILPSEIRWPAYRSGYERDTTSFPATNAFHERMWFFHPFSYYYTSATAQGVPSATIHSATADPVANSAFLANEALGGVLPWWTLQKGGLANVAGYRSLAATMPNAATRDNELPISQPVPSVDEPNELILDPRFRDAQRDRLFEPGELAGLLLSNRDLAASGLRSRIRDLAPLNLEASGRAGEIRSRFTTDSWDRLEHGVRPLMTVDTSALPGGQAQAVPVRPWEFNHWYPVDTDFYGDSLDPINNFLIRDNGGTIQRPTSPISTATPPTIGDLRAYYYTSPSDARAIDDCFPPQFGLGYVADTMDTDGDGDTTELIPDLTTADDVPVFSAADPFRPELRRLLMKFGGPAPMITDTGGTEIERLDNLPGGIETMRRIALARKLELDGILADGVASDGTVLPAFLDWRLGPNTSIYANTIDGEAIRLSQSSEPNYRPLTPHIAFTDAADATTLIDSPGLTLPPIVHSNLPTAQPTISVPDFPSNASNNVTVSYLAAIGKLRSGDVETYTDDGTNDDNLRLVQEWMARQDRQRLARDIYVLLYTTCGPLDWDPTTQSPADPNVSINALTQAPTNQPRRLDLNKLPLEALVDEMAQFAVNVVDQIDSDSVITRFEYDRDLSDGWQPDRTVWDGTNGLQASYPSVYPAPGGQAAHQGELGLVNGIEDQTLTFSEATLVATQPAAEETPDNENDFTPWNDEFSRQFLQMELRNAGARPVELYNGNWRLLRLDLPPTPPSTPQSQITAAVRFKHATNAADGRFIINGGENFTLAAGDNGALTAAGAASPNQTGDIYLDFDGVDAAYELFSSNENGNDPAAEQEITDVSTVSPLGPASNLDLTYTVGGTGTPIAPRQPDGEVMTGAHSSYFDLTAYTNPVDSTYAGQATILATPDTEGQDEFAAAAGTATDVTFVLQRRRGTNQFDQFANYLPPTAAIADLVAEPDWVEVDRMFVTVGRPSFDKDNDDNLNQLASEIWGEAFGGVTFTSNDPSRQHMRSNYRVHPFARDRTLPYTIADAQRTAGITSGSMASFPKPHTYEEAGDITPANGTFASVGYPVHDTNGKPPFGTDMTADGTLPNGVEILPFPWQPHFNRRLVSTAELLATPLYGYRTYETVGGGAINPHDMFGRTFDQGANTTGTPAVTILENDVYGGPTANLTDQVGLGPVRQTSVRVTPHHTAARRFQRPDGTAEQYGVQPPLPIRLDADPQPTAAPAANASQTQNSWHRLLSLVGVPDRTEQTLVDYSTPSSTNLRGGRDVREARTRRGGLVNINDIQDQTVLAALLDDQTDITLYESTGGTFPNATGHFDYFNAAGRPAAEFRMLDDTLDQPTFGERGFPNAWVDGSGNDVRNWWDEFRVSRDGWDDFTLLPIPGTFRSRPFHQTGTPIDDNDPSYRDGTGVNRLHRRDVPDVNAVSADALIPFDNGGLVAAGDTAPNRIGDNAGRDSAAGAASAAISLGETMLFEARSRGDASSQDGTIADLNGTNQVDPWSRNRLLSKVLNNTTERSHVFGVWVVVRFFEADHDPADRNLVRIGAEAEDLPVFREFCVLDMSRIEEAYVDNDPDDNAFGTFRFERFLLHRRRLQ